MKYYLDSNFTFCGWEGLPFALMDTQSKDVTFFDREQFKLLWSCNAYENIDADALTGDMANFFAGMLKSGVIHEAEPGMRLQIHERVQYPCRYRSDVQLSLTGKCNYRCLHCLQSAPHGVLGQPTTQQIIDELDQLAECGIFRVSLTGGEPLIHEGFWEIIDHMCEKNIKLTVMYSNGALVDEALLDGFEARGVKPSWSISFDGLGYHDHMRGVEGAEEAAIRAIKLLVSRGYTVGCAYTLTKGSVAVFRDTVNYLASLGVGAMKSGCTIPQGEWLNRPEEWLTDQDYLDFYRTYIPQYIADGRPLGLQFEGLFTGRQDAELRYLKTKYPAANDEESAKEQAPYYFMCERNVPEEILSKMLSCESLKTAFYIGPTGRVLPCMGIDGTPAGEQFDSMWDVPLREILSEGSYFIEATEASMLDVFNHNEAECADCTERSHCGSGCRAAAVARCTDDYLARDTRTCLICKEGWSSKIREAIAAAGLD